MQLNKFGAVLKFAIDMEQRSVAFYERSGRDFEDAARAARKRLSRLQLMRRELVNEMLLEPIRDFQAPSLPDPNDPATIDAGNVRQAAEQLAEIRARFYAAAAEKLALIAPSVTRAFEKMR